jgi:hypothetical protein
MTTSLPEVYLDNDHEFEYDLKRKATTTGEWEAAADLVSVTAHYSAEDGGAAIGSTSTSLTERSAKDGRYFGILNSATVNTDLAAYTNQKVYRVFVVDGDAETSTPVVVKATRRPS